MTRAIYVASIAPGSGKVLIALGLIELALRETPRVGFFRPVIAGGAEDGVDPDIQLMLSHFGLNQSPADSFAWHQADLFSRAGSVGIDDVLERIIRVYRDLALRCDVVIVEGSDYQSQASAIEFELNARIARDLSAATVLVGSARGLSLETAREGLKAALEAYQRHSASILGVVLNRATASVLEGLESREMPDFSQGVPLLGMIPEDPLLGVPSVGEIAKKLGAEFLLGSDRSGERVTGFEIGAMRLEHLMVRLSAGMLVVMPGDRVDLLLGLVLADRSLNAPRLSALILTSNLKPCASVLHVLMGVKEPLPVLTTALDTQQAYTQLIAYQGPLSAGRPDQVQRALDLFESHAGLPSLKPFLQAPGSETLRPRMFTATLWTKARQVRRHIVLPEGEEPRIVQAVAELLERRAVTVSLLGRESALADVLRARGLKADGEELRLVDPSTSPDLERYAQLYQRLRARKGVTQEQAQDLLLDVGYFGTLMVCAGDADGMVSGAVHTTQHTLRPALQLLRAGEGQGLVSSVFFMCLESGVVVYGDCAVNPDPTAEQLADIAIQSAATASRFGIPPRVALLSYSTGTSGHGADVDKVRDAVEVILAKRPNWPVDGPIQYDAAVDAAVARLKRPGSEVAGAASVLIFPDLNTGNNTYKAVQRETGALAIGPILQGLVKPVNDLSRGCSVADIVHTVLITAIQATP